MTGEWRVNRRSPRRFGIARSSAAPLVNPKLENRNPKQIRNPKKKTKRAKQVLFSCSNFGFVSDFGFRVSDLPTAGATKISANGDGPWDSSRVASRSCAFGSVAER